MSEFAYRFLPTAIGSMPQTAPEAACSMVLSHLKEIPAWPQLPKRSFREKMWAQFSEGFPGLTIQGERVLVDRSTDWPEDLSRLYVAYLEYQLQEFAIGPEYAAGLHQFLSMELEGVAAVKGQVTGPITFALAIKDQAGRPLLHDPVWADGAAKHLRLTAAWQERALQNRCPNTILIVDEPSLGVLTAGEFPLLVQEGVDLLEEVFQGIAGLKGLHCCGAADWSPAFETSMDILSLDVYNHPEALLPHAGALRGFLERGGAIAWGIVPTNEEDLGRESVPLLIARLQETFSALARQGVDLWLLEERSLITPSCGLVGLSLQGAERALKLTAQVAATLRAGSAGGSLEP